MKSLIALFSEKGSGESFTSFNNDVLSVNELINVRGGGEAAPREEIPIIIPPGEGKK